MIEDDINRAWSTMAKKTHDDPKSPWQWTIVLDHTRRAETIFIGMERETKMCVVGDFPECMKTRKFLGAHSNFLVAWSEYRINSKDKSIEVV